MDLKQGIENFSNTKIAVIGDVMLDSYLYGKCNRLSPEAPVPVVRKENIIYELGGAANVAANISSLGGNVYLFGYYAEDYNGKILVEKLNEKKINCYLYPLLTKTTHKMRVIGDRMQQICRIDEEQKATPSLKLEEEILDRIFSLNPNIIVASDYAKGALSKNLFFGLKEKAKRENKKIIVDPRPQNKSNYFGVYLITPNIKEGKEMSNTDSVENIGRILQRELNADILLTRGEEGMTLFEGEKIINLPTHAKKIYDIIGAGDSVVAGVALSLASGLNLEESAFLANHIAGIVVSKPGTATVSRKELEEVIETEHKKIKNLDELKIIRETYKNDGKKIVWTNGCFDLLHSGHVRYLNEAKKLGDCLIVGLNNDDSVRKLKGKNRPLTPEKERAEILSALESVDYVFLFPDLGVEKYLTELKPDIFVKGGDYTIDSINPSEKKVIEKYNGKIEIISVGKDISTTKIIEKIKNS